MFFEGMECIKSKCDNCGNYIHLPKDGPEFKDVTVEIGAVIKDQTCSNDIREPDIPTFFTIVEL